MTTRGLVAIASATAALAACGATPPQAPLPDAKRLDSATSAIAAACGQSYQVTAFAGNHGRDLRALDAAATNAAGKLSRVFGEDAGWIYQGKTVREIAQDATSVLRDCDLRGAANALAAATRSN